MYTSVVLMLLVSGPPADDTQIEVAKSITAAITDTFKDRKPAIDIEVYSERRVVVSGKLNNVDELTRLLDAVSPHVTSLTLNVSAGPKPPKARDWPDRGFPPGWPSYDLDWNDGSGQESWTSGGAQSPGLPSRN